jgi:hypothetical protein
MELNGDIDFNQLLDVIRKLPDDKISILRAELSIDKLPNPTPINQKFRELLLKGPVMDDDQYKAYKLARTRFNKWRTT